MSTDTCTSPDCLLPAITAKQLCLRHEADRLAARQAEQGPRNEQQHWTDA